MQPFELHRARDPQEAARHARAVTDQSGSNEIPRACFIAGGTNMVDYMTLDVLEPSLLVDINGMGDAYRKIEISSQRLRFGSLVRMSEAEDHPAIKRDWPIIHQTLFLAASRQIRNMASLGGNVLQRTRCEYFRETSWPCNKRKPGSGCAALEGLNRQHAILGGSDHCIAAYAGDFAQALIALDATVETFDGASRSTRRIPFSELHRRPGDTPNVETTLHPAELITFIDIPVTPWTRRSRYIKIRDRQSYQFALASAAVALDLDGDVVREARIALGGVATIPWRAREAEAVLQGKPLTESLAAEAASAAFAAAHPRAHNAFKLQLGQQALVRALLEAKQLEV